MASGPQQVVGSSGIAIDIDRQLSILHLQAAEKRVIRAPSAKKHSVSQTFQLLLAQFVRSFLFALLRPASWPLPRATSVLLPQRPITAEGPVPHRLDGPVDSCHLIVGHRGTAPHSHYLPTELEIHQVRSAHALPIVPAHASHCYESSEGGGEYNRGLVESPGARDPEHMEIYFLTPSPPSMPSSHIPSPQT